MGFRPLLGLINRRNTDKPRLVRITEAGAEYYGPPLPLAGEVEHQVGTSRQVNKATYFEGEPWVIHSGTIFRLSQTTNQWVQEYRFADWTAAVTQKRGAHAGLHKAMISGIPHLMTAYPTPTSPNWRGVKFNSQSRVWTESAAVNRSIATTNVDFATNGIVFQNKLYWWHGTGASSSAPITLYDPVTNTATAVATPSWNIPSSVDVCIYKNRLMYVVNNAASNTTLYEIPQNSKLTLDTTHDDSVQSQYGMWTDGDFLYVMTLVTTSAVRVKKISVDGVGTWTQTDITNAVLPIALLPGGTHILAEKQFWVITDCHDTSSPPTTYIAYARTLADTLANGTLYDIYKWNGPNAPMTKCASSSLSLNYSFFHDKTGGGNKNFIPGQPEVEVITAQNNGTPGDIRLTYRIKESYLYPSGTPCSVFFLCSPGKHQTLDTVALLRPNSTFPDGNINNNVIEDLITGSGHIRNVVWRAGLQGATPSGFFQPIAGVVEIV